MTASIDPNRNDFWNPPAPENTGPGQRFDYVPHTGTSDYKTVGVGGHEEFSNGDIYDSHGSRVNGPNANSW
jgi:hypothetical protein